MMKTIWVWATHQIPLHKDLVLYPHKPVRITIHEMHYAPDAADPLQITMPNTVTVELADGREFDVPAEHIENAPKWAVELQKLGIEFTLGYQGFSDSKKPPTVGNIRPNWTAEQWIDLMSKEGRWLGACCANISAMRDIVFSARREDGWFGVNELVELIELMQGHEGFMEMFEPDFDIAAALHTSDSVDDLLGDILTGGDQEEDPWVQLAAVWPHIKDHLQPSDLDTSKEITDIDGALSILNRGVSILDYRSMFQGQARMYTSEYYPHESEEWLEERRKQEDWNDCTSMLSTLLMFVPALHTVWHQIKALYPDPLSGIAVLLTQTWVWDEQEDPKTGKTKRIKKEVFSTDAWGHGILMTRNGPALYPTLEEAEKSLSIWESQGPTIREKIKFVGFTASVEDGIKLNEAPDA